MDSKCFYGKKVTYPNSNNDTEISDESAFSDSNNDSDYLPIKPTTLLFQNDTSNSKYFDNDKKNENIVFFSDSGSRIPV